MNKEFDPYLNWLGVAPEDQPANHYRLLGVPELIDDADVIESAADRQMAHVRTFASGQHSQLSQRILSEISKAKICLLNPKEKLAYDQTLRAPTASQTPPPRRAQPVLKTRQAPQSKSPQTQPPAPAVAANPTVTSKPPAHLKKRSSSGLQAAIVLGLLVTVAGLAWGIYMATSSNPVVAEHEDDTVTPTVPPVEPPDKTPPPVVVVDPAVRPDKTPPKDPPTPPVVVEKPDDPVGSDEPSDPPVRGKPIDLLRRIDLARDVVEGDWKMDGGALVSPEDLSIARVMVPVAVPEEFELTLEVERLSGDNTLVVGLVAAGKQLETYFDAHGEGKPPISGFTNFQPSLSQNEPVLKTGNNSLIQYHVTHSRIVATVNGETVLDRSYNSKMGVHPSWAIARKDVLFLGTTRSSFRIHKFELTPLGDAVVAVNDPPPQSGKTVDLLKQIDLKRDVVQGNWKFDGQILVTPTNLPDVRLMLPPPVADEYTLEMQVERVSGNNMFLVVLVVKGKQVQMFFDYHGPGQSPHSSMAPAGNFPARQGSLLHPGKSHRIRCHVSNSRVVVQVDDEVILDQREGFGEMSLSEHWKVPRKDVLSLGCQFSTFRIHKLELTPLADGVDPLAPPIKLSLPYGQVLEKAQATLSDVFKEDLTAAKTSKDRIDLAKTLLETSAEEGSDPAETYVMLRAARKLAAKAGDAKTAITAIDRLDEQFAIDMLEMKAEVLADVAGSVRLPADQAALATLAGGVVLEMVEADRFDLAEPLTKLVQTAATRSRNVGLRKEVAASVKQFGVLRERYRKVQASFEKLRETPDDPQANLAVGRYRAYFKRDWSSGLANLAAGNDETLKALAKQDLAGADSPGDQVKLGDAWWKLAEAETGETQKAMKIRAGHWYEEAMAGLTGLFKEKVSKRLDEIHALDPSGRINLKDWEVRCWDGQWKSYPVSKIKTEFSGGILNLTNTTGIHTHAWMIFRPFVANRPFTATFEIRGDFRAVGLASEKGDDGHSHISGEKDGQWHVYLIRRTSDGEYQFAQDGQPIKPTTHKDRNNFDGQLGLTLYRDQTCSIRHFDIRIETK